MQLPDRVFDRVESTVTDPCGETSPAGSRGRLLATVANLESCQSLCMRALFLPDAAVVACPVFLLVLPPVGWTREGLPRGYQQCLCVIILELSDVPECTHAH